ncbi:MFS transporter, UMF1 family [Desulfonauticus submarinus]|uniref:MFS transporter, UMF1 family n=1 Tax=Desulfonauticus submarinus TaxID=206665 RepID=A0A1G9ZSQ9_9BACT|nr:MFS transporter [Desulfonauticus submarinus]SDN24308.1 MFS transporter, UMF1 family [Desulfonauticus submarinus]
MDKIVNRVKLKQRSILSWCLYDFANSSYSAVIIAVIFPVFFVSHIVGGPRGDLLWGRAISLSMFVSAILAPILGAIADFCKIKKFFFIGFTLLGSLIVCCMSFLQAGDIYWAFWLIVSSNIFFESSLIFYNSFLLDISSYEVRGRVSSWGFGLGYIGSIFALSIGLYWIKRDLIFFTWLSTGLFWLIFSFPAFIFLPKDTNRVQIYHGIKKGINLFKEAVKSVFINKNLLKFLLAYFLYIDAINTIIVFSSIFASSSLKMSLTELIFLYIVVQLSAAIGSFLLSKYIDIKGPKIIISYLLVFWCLVIIGVYFVNNKDLFFLLACIAGFGLGSIQSSSRAMFSYFIPKGEECKFFGFYGFIGKSSAIIGPLVFGLISYYTSNQRFAVLSLLVFIILGLLFINLIDE